MNATQQLSLINLPIWEDSGGWEDSTEWRFEWRSYNRPLVSHSL